MQDDKYSFTKKFIEGEAKSGFWSIVLYGIVALNSFSIIYFLSVYEYGVYQLILSVVVMAGSLTAGILEDVVFSDMSRYIGTGEKVLARKLFWEYTLLRIALAVVLMFLLIIFSRMVSAHYGYNIAYSVSLAALALPFLASISAMSLFFRSSICFSALGTSVFGEMSKLVVILLLWFWQGLGITQVLISYLAGQVLSFLFAGAHFLRLYRRIFIRTEGYVSGSLVFKLFKKYGVWIFVRYILAKIAGNIRPWVMKIFISTEAIGFFSFAQSIISMIMSLLPFGMFGDLLPREIRDKKRVRFLFVHVIKYSAWLSLLCAVLSYFLLPPLVNIFLPKYGMAMVLFKFMTPAIFLYGLYKFFRMTLVVFKEQKILTLKSFDNSILTPLTLMFLLPLFGVAGAAIEYVLTYAVTTFLFYFNLVRVHPYLVLRLKELLVIDEYDRMFFMRIYRSAKGYLKDMV